MTFLLFANTSSIEFLSSIMIINKAETNANNAGFKEQELNICLLFFIIDFLVYYIGLFMILSMTNIIIITNGMDIPITNMLKVFL